MRWRLCPAVLLALVSLSPCVQAAELPGATDHFRTEIHPILARYCSKCHFDGMNRGGVALDEFKSDDNRSARPELWSTVLRYVRAGLMPPATRPRPSAEERKLLEDWIKFEALGIDPQDPDPGHVTIRRLNRIEYRNTIRDLMGVDFDTETEFPPDDAGHGFDNLGDVLTLPPMLLEKYLAAATSIVSRATTPAETVIPASSFAGAGGGADSDKGPLSVSCSERVSVSSAFPAKHTGHYQLVLNLTAGGQRGDEDLDSTKCRLVFKADGEELLKQEYTDGGSRPPRDGFRSKIRDRDLLLSFARKAYRRPVDDETVDRLTALAESASRQPGQTVEAGLAHAMVAVLASPRFLFREEGTEPITPGQAHPFVDQYALASRLSYFLWSSMPDDELFRLADEGALRKDLAAQVRRMLADPRSEALMKNFTGQWLRARDIQTVFIDGRAVLAREANPEIEGARTPLGELRDDPKARTTAEAREESAKIGAPSFRSPSPPPVNLTGELRAAMRQETEKVFEYIVREDRSLLELIASDYTFLNERLAKHYGVPNIEGGEMRRVTLPPDSPRGGILTQGTVLAVTSNPTRTSPVKRGLFILDNILGTPPPPPPPDITPLERAGQDVKDRTPTLRETLAMHRSNPSCGACHNRMDPPGLALEQFNAIGMWRETERGHPIDTAGKLITGEDFNGIRDLKRILVREHRRDFYRTLTEKLLTYALGRGLEYYDVETVDRIVERVEKSDGRPAALLMGIIESAAFQKTRISRARPTFPSNSRPAGQPARAGIKP